MLFNKLKWLLFTIIFLTSNMMVQAQQIEMADALRSSGKIYVVVGVLVIIFIGIVGFLIHLERKLNKLEKHIENIK